MAKTCQHHTANVHLESIQHDVQINSHELILGMHISNELMQHLADEGRTHIASPCKPIAVQINSHELILGMHISIELMQHVADVGRMHIASPCKPIAVQINSHELILGMHVSNEVM
jgi:hypothetical protein